MLLREVHSPKGICSNKALFRRLPPKSMVKADDRGMSVARYRALLHKHFPDGNVPRAVLPPTKRITKRPRKFQCEHCAFCATTRGILRRHKADVHDLNVVWESCTFEYDDGSVCSYRGKTKDDVREHLRKAHNIGVRWHECDQVGCVFKTKTASALVKHKANRHDIGVIWHHCQVPGCTFTCKQRGNLLQHQRWMHSGRRITHPSRLERNRAPVEEANQEENMCVLCTVALDSESEPSPSPPPSPTADSDSSDW